MRCELVPDHAAQQARTSVVASVVNHDAPCTERHHTFPCSHYLGIVEPRFLEPTEATDAPCPVPFSPQPPQERADNAEKPCETGESVPKSPERPQPITPVDASAAACEALACAAAQLLDVAQSDDPAPAAVDRVTDGIWQLQPWQLAAVAAWLNARADLYRVTR